MGTTTTGFALAPMLSETFNVGGVLAAYFDDFTEPPSRSF